MDYSLEGRPTANICLKQVRVINPARQQDEVTDVYIHHGEVAGFGTAPQGFKGETVHCEGFWLLPGAIDLSARLCEPGYEHKGNIHSESKAAAAGGITHLVCPPDTQPVIDTPAVANLIREKAYQSGYAHVLPLGAMTSGLEGDMLSEMRALQEAGCVGVSQLRRPIKNTKVLLRCLEYAATFNITVFFQSEDSSLAAGGVAHGGAQATRLGLPGIPGCAETIALGRDLLLVEQTGVRAHFGQLSCARSVELVAAAQAKGLPVTADVSAHQLTFTEDAVDGFNSTHHVMPPYRTEADRQALLEGVNDGIIGMICSDHQPHEAAAKAAPFAVTEPGISALESFLPATYHWVRENRIDLHRWVNAVSTNAAKLLAIDAGEILGDEPANLVLFNPRGSTDISTDTLLSEGKN
ncbi:MAG: dihydroorotase, partial [Ketobacteraceae bacterium]|nr:dihydroorotase [Ketobacteraceae bacterium]